MFRKLIIIIILFSSMKANAQKQLDGNTIEVIKQILTDKRPFHLVSSITNDYEIEQIKQALSQNLFTKKITYSETKKTVTDSLVLTEEDRKIIDNSLAKIKDVIWNTDILNECSISNADIVDSNYCKAKMPNFRNRVYRIMKPIFIKNNSICIIYISLRCGGLCGHSYLHIYKKENDEWIFWMPLRESVS